VSEADEGAQKYGAIDRVYNGIVEATFNIPDGSYYVSDFVAGVIHGTDLPTSFGEAVIYHRQGRDVMPRKEDYGLGNKAISDKNADLEYARKQKAQRVRERGLVVGALVPGIAAAVTKEPAFLLPYTTNVTNGLNYVDRNHITGKYDNWGEVDEAVEDAYEEAKEAVSEGIELLGNARDNIIRGTRTFMRNTRIWAEHLASDEYLDFHDPEIEEFWHAARQFEEHEYGEITGIEYEYSPHPEEMDMREIEKHMNSMKKGGSLEFNDEDFTVLEVQGKNGNPRMPDKTYKLKVDARINIDDTDPDPPEREIFELSVSWPADYSDPRLFGSEEDEEESFGEREPELARE